MKSFQVLVSPLQPEAFIIKDVVDIHEAIEKVLKESWGRFPGFFNEAPENVNCYEFKGKYLKEGYPSVQEIIWN